MGTWAVPAPFPSGHVCEGSGWERAPTGTEARQFLFIARDATLWLQTGSKPHMTAVLHLRTREEVRVCECTGQGSSRMKEREGTFHKVMV